MLEFKPFRSVRVIVQSIELKHLIGRGQLPTVSGRSPSAAEQIYALAAKRRLTPVQSCSLETQWSQIYLYIFFLDIK